MADVFISYASADRETAAKLADALADFGGWSVWWDREISVGERFDQLIERELRQAKGAVVLWSEKSVESDWVRNEARAAAKRRALAPALIDPVDIPIEFSNLQTADLTDWKGERQHEGLRRRP